MESEVIDGNTGQVVVGDGGVAAARQQLMDEAAKMKAKIGSGGGDKIRLTKKKTFKLPDGQETTPGTPLRVAVLDFVAFKTFFDRPYNDKDKTPPACFALGATKLIELVPHASSPDRQSPTCGVPQKSGCCPNNEFGTKGGGKICSDHYVLAVTGVDKPDGDMYTLQIPPTSVRYWEACVQQTLAQYPGLLAASLEIWFDPEKDYQMLRFGRPLDNPFLVQHMARRAVASARLLTPPDVSTYEKPAKASRK